MKLIDIGSVFRIWIFSGFSDIGLIDLFINQLLIQK